METPPAEELLKKIQELEAGQAHLKNEMSKLLQSSSSSCSASVSSSAADVKSDHHHNHNNHHRRPHQRSHSISPQRSRLAGGCSTAAPRRRAGAGLEGLASFRHSSPLQRESRSRDPCHGGGGGGGGGGGVGPSAVNFNDRQYLNILQSMGQSVHIFDLTGGIIYW